MTFLIIDQIDEIEDTWDNKQVEKYKDELDEGSGGMRLNNILKTIMLVRE